MWLAWDRLHVSQNVTWHAMWKMPIVKSHSKLNQCCYIMFQTIAATNPLEMQLCLKLDTGQLQAMLRLPMEDDFRRSSTGAEGSVVLPARSRRNWQHSWRVLPLNLFSNHPQHNWLSWNSCVSPVGILCQVRVCFCVFQFTTLCVACVWAKR